MKDDSGATCMIMLFAVAMALLFLAILILGPEGASTMPPVPTLGGL